MPRMTQKRINRIRDIVKSITKETNKKRLRYDVLNEIARRHNVRYETIKGDLYAISYAFYKGPKEYQIVDIPKEYRKSVKSLRKLAEMGVLDPAECAKASEAFLEHAPWVDKERIVRVHGINDPEVIRKIDEIGKYLQGIYKTRHKMWKVHPARAYSYVWNHIGRKLHQELENAREITERLHSISQKQNLTKSDEAFLKRLGISKKDIERYINKNATFEENLKNMYLRILNHNLDYARAVWHYEQARGHHVSLYRRLKEMNALDKLGKAPQAKVGSIRNTNKLMLGDMIESNYKNIRRWNVKPGSKWVGFSKRYKRITKNMAEDGMVVGGSRDDPWILTKAHMKIIGYHIGEGDRIYAQIKEREKEDKILKAIVKWKPTRGGKR